MNITWSRSPILLRGAQRLREHFSGYPWEYLK